MKLNFSSSRIGIVAILVSAAVLASCASTATSTSNGIAARTGDPVKAARQAKAEPQEKEREPRLAASDKARKAARRTGEIYLMRGLMDIFSRGIDQMAAQMRRNGLYAVDTSYTEWENIAADLVRRARTKDISYPVIIIGHSLGANDASRLANYLGSHDVKVDLVVTFDPTEPGYIGKNVSTVVNYYLPHDEDNRIRKRTGFRGSLVNVNVSDNPDITHTTIEKNSELQAKTIARVMRLTRPKR